MTRSKQESTATIKLVNLATKRDSVFMASSSGVGPNPSPFWPEDAVSAHPFWLRPCRVRSHLDEVESCWSLPTSWRRRRDGSRDSGVRHRPGPGGARRSAGLEAGRSNAAEEDRSPQTR